MPTTDWFITLQGGPKHTEECPHKEFTNQAVSKRSSIQDIRLQFLVQGYLVRLTLASSLTQAPPIASCGTHQKTTDSKIAYHLIKVLGLLVPFPTSA
jgi:hypothetical protein